MKSISITRLKRIVQVHSIPLRLHPWNEKHLDYEIETLIGTFLRKPKNAPLKWKASRLRDWNSLPDLSVKVDLVELEMKSISITRLKLVCHHFIHYWRTYTWNEKHLDYEIETDRLDIGIFDNISYLKWKASRLRDWNFNWFLLTKIWFLILEMKSISITRLKPGVNSPSAGVLAPWNEKHLDYEIETAWY